MNDNKAIPENSVVRLHYKFCGNIILIFNFTLQLLLLLKPAAHAQVGKNKINYKLLLQPHKHLRQGKTEKHNSGKQPTIDCFLKPI